MTALLFGHWHRQRRWQQIDGRKGYGHSMRNLVVRRSRLVSERRKREEGPALFDLLPLDSFNPSGRPITPAIKVKLVKVALQLISIHKTIKESLAVLILQFLALLKKLSPRPLVLNIFAWLNFKPYTSYKLYILLSVSVLVGWFLFSKISETYFVHVPKLFPLLHWFQNTFCFLSSSTPSHVGKFFRLQWEFQWENDQNKKMAKKSLFRRPKWFPKCLNGGFRGGICIEKWS